MSNLPDIAASPSSSVPVRRAKVFARPISNVGWWSVGLGAGFVALLLVNLIVFMPSTGIITWREVILPFFAGGMLLCGLAAGIVALISVVRRGERSWMVLLILLAGLMLLVFLLGELLVPH